MNREPPPIPPNWEPVGRIDFWHELAVFWPVFSFTFIVVFVLLCLVGGLL